jgi:hypothetical protein
MACPGAYYESGRLVGKQKILEFVGVCMDSIDVFCGVTLELVWNFFLAGRVCGLGELWCLDFDLLDPDLSRQSCWNPLIIDASARS